MVKQIAAFAAGYAADLATANGQVWLAWCTCETDELSLLTEVRRNWPLLPDVTPEDWRAHPRPQFRLYLDTVGAGGGAPAPQLLASSDSYLQGPVVVMGRNSGPWVVWGEHRADGYALCAWHEGRHQTFALSCWPMLQPAATVQEDGTLWVAWQARASAANGVPAVFVRSLAPGGSGDAPAVPATCISLEGASAWSPALAASPGGGVWCAWDTYQDGSYRIMLSQASASGAWQPPQPISASNVFDLAPSVAVDTAGRVWVAWSRADRWGLTSHRLGHQRAVHVRVIEAGTGAVSIPAGYNEAGAVPIPITPLDTMPLDYPDEDQFVVPLSPTIVPDGQGATVLYRSLHVNGYKAFGWDIRGMTHTGAGWTAPRRLSSGIGFPDTRYGAAFDENGDLWLAYHACDVPDPISGGDSAPAPPERFAYNKHAVANERMLVDRVRPSDEARAALETRSVVVLAPAPKLRRTQTVDRGLQFGSSSYRLLFGDLHRHSLYSKCQSANDGQVLDHWRWAADVAGLDFYAVTEHLDFLSYSEWAHTNESATLMAQTAGVVPLYGFELTRQPGHTNFFYVDPSVGHDLRIACLSSFHLSQVWEKLDRWTPPGSVLAIRHHQGHIRPEAIDSFAPRYERLLEVVQSRGEFRGFADRFLQRGCRAGFAGASDHAMTAPFPFCLTGAWAIEQTRPGVFDALWQRRTFATNGPKMRLFLSASGVPMGSGGSGAPELRVEAEGTTTLERVEFFRDGRLIHVEPLETRQAVVTYTDPAAASGTSQYYYVRVVQEPERPGFRPQMGVAYSSPVWLEIP